MRRSVVAVLFQLRALSLSLTSLNVGGFHLRSGPAAHRGASSCWCFAVSRRATLAVYRREGIAAAPFGSQV
ncbi:MAG TPA: hypothetical protein ENI37_08480 [Chloroflexi bacterium]|nr:hypothetical protein [Chloroflexota bacterium]